MQNKNDMENETVMSNTITPEQPSRARLLSKFDILATTKKLTGKDLEKESRIFFAWCTKKGYANCPFPEWLVKFHLGEWEPNS